MPDDKKKPDVRFLLDEILSGDDKRAQLARVVLLTLGEDAVSTLADEFYAGVSEAHGVVILDVAAEIGGPEAMQLLEDTIQHTNNPVWRRWAVLGLARNYREDISEIAFDWLQSGETPSRQAAALALGYVGGDAANIALIHALHDPDINGQAVRSLARRKNVEGLAAGFQTDNASVWQQVTEALLGLGDAGTLPLINIMQSEHPEYYEKVLVSLQNSARPEAKEVLRAGEYNPDGTRKDS